MFCQVVRIFPRVAPRPRVLILLEVPSMAGHFTLDVSHSLFNIIAN